MRQVSPLLTFASITRISLPHGGVLIHCTELSVSERRALAAGVAKAEELCQAMRAEESGLVIAPAGTRLPEVKGR